MARTEHGIRWFYWPLIVLAVAVLLPLALVLLAFWLLYGIVLQAIVWIFWYPRGRRTLVVYSNSPVWQEYFEQQILPAVGTRAVVLNWSERARWRYTLAVALFRFFGGNREFNPMVIVFRPFRWARALRFYRPFKRFKHGHPEQVEALRRELLELLGARQGAIERDSRHGT